MAVCCELWVVALVVPPAGWWRCPAWGISKPLALDWCHPAAVLCDTGELMPWLK